MTQSNAPLLIGIDGGGTKTECWLAVAPTQPARASDDIEVIGKGRAGGSNPRTVGVEAACAALDQAIAAAFRDAGRERTRAAACVLGLAGSGDVGLRRAVSNWAASRPVAENTEVLPDYELPLFAAAPDGVGIVLISGTGSVAFGRNPCGQTARIGGWGYLLGDLGSAYAIAREALEEACRAEDGGRMPTSLPVTLMNHFCVSSMREVADAIYRSSDPRQAIASAARAVFANSECGDRLARKIIDQARDILCEMVTVLADRLTLDVAGCTLTLALAGSVLVHEREFLDGLITSASESLSATIRPVLVPDPAAGGVSAALRRHQAAHRVMHGPSR